MTGLVFYKNWGVARNYARRVGITGLPLFAATVAANTDLSVGILCGTACSAIALATFIKPRPYPSAGRQLYRTDRYILANLAPLTRVDAPHPAVMFTLSLDGFDDWAQRHDPAAVRRVISKTYDRLAHVLRQDTLLLHGADHRFYAGFLITNQPNANTMIAIARRLQRAIDPAYVIDDTPHYFSLSIGFATTDHPAILSAKDLMRAARVGLGAAQRAGNGAIRMFAHDMDETGQINDHPSSPMLAQALKQGDIVPHFQPQICAHSNQVIGVEALARWQQPDGTFVAPNVFLPVLESAGLMRQTTGHILNCALHARRVWADQGCHIATVSVNLSSEDLSDPRLVDQIRWHLRRHKPPATALRLEVVENVVIKNADDIISKNIHALGHLGCQIDLDDFGTGHASIPSLRHAGLNRLKIDRSFITHCDSDPKQKRLLSAMVAMAQELDLKIVAEGVETIGEQCEVIRQGADVIQGYAIARPMPGHDIPKWVEKYHSLVGHARGIG